MQQIKKLIPLPARQLVRRLKLALSTFRYERDKKQIWDDQAIEYINRGDYRELPEWAIIWRDMQSYILPIAAENNIRQAIDIGCGTGWLVHRLARVMDHVRGYDISPSIIAYVKTASELENVTLEAVDLSLESPKIPRAKYLVTSMYVLSHNSARRVNRILQWVDSICELGSVCLLSEAWKIGKTVQLSAGDYYHGVDEVWNRALRNWDLSFLGDLTTPFEADRVYFRQHPRQNTRGCRVGKGIVGVKAA